MNDEDLYWVGGLSMMGYITTLPVEDVECEAVRRLRRVVEEMTGEPTPGEKPRAIGFAIVAAG